MAKKMTKQIKVELKEIEVKEQAGMAHPMTGVPNLNNLADGCDMMATQLSNHSKILRGMAQMQPDFNQEFGLDSGLPTEMY